MKITVLAFVVVLLVASTLAQDITTTNETSSISSTNSTPTTTTTISSTAVPTTSSSQPTTSSSAQPITSSTAKPTTTSIAPETTPTAASTNTTIAPETTTPTAASTTTSVTPETTPVSPSSTTEPPITSTVAPIPDPGYWNVTDGNTTCIRASLAVRFKISETKYIALLSNATTEGSKCNTSDGSELLVLGDNEKDYSVTFVFEKNSDDVYVKSISFISGSIEGYNNETHLFQVKSGNSYLCKTPSNVMLGNITMEINHIQIQAFGAENNKDFGSADECGADNPINDVVPIAVGIALLALVVVVLIAYLVGRRRSRQKGYQSV